jgi:hypothetical protein
LGVPGLNKTMYCPGIGVVDKAVVAAVAERTAFGVG